MKSHLIAFTASLALASIGAAAAPAPLYVDLSHGGMAAPNPPLVATAKKIGLEVVGGQEPLSTATLRTSRIAYLRTPTKPYSAEAKTAVISFVREGGSLLVIVDEERRTPLSTGINDILAPFGLKLTGDTDYIHNQGGLAKAGTIHAQDREIPFSGGRAVEGGTPFAWQLDREGKPSKPFAAYKQLENGARIIVMSDAMASAYLGVPEGVRLSGVPKDPTKTTYWGKDSAIFMEEVLTWLAKR